MNKLSLSEEDIELLNSPFGLKFLLADKKPNYQKALRLTRYELALRQLQEQLIDLQYWVIGKKERVVILFEGRDAAGKGGAIRRISAHINPRFYRIVALPKPTDEERGQWYFQRYVNQLPKPGEIVFFNRSWYNRAVVEPVNSFCTQEEYERFMFQVNGFENMLIDSGIHLIKLYFSIDKEEQVKRFRDIKRDPLKRWKMTPVDARAQELWDEYTTYKERMFAHTHTEKAPWTIIKANRKPEARMEAAQVVLSRISYEKLEEEE